MQPCMCCSHLQPPTPHCPCALQQGGGTLQQTPSATSAASAAGWTATTPALPASANAECLEDMHRSCSAWHALRCISCTWRSLQVASQVCCMAAQAGQHRACSGVTCKGLGCSCCSHSSTFGASKPQPVCRLQSARASYVWRAAVRVSTAPLTADTTAAAAAALEEPVATYRHPGWNHRSPLSRVNDKLETQG
jgi:hypothetical protein